LESDTTLGIRVFMDNTILEVYWQGGRVAMTLGLDESGVTGVDIFSFSDGDSEEMLRVNTVEAWQMGSIWVTPRR
jgi:hypothetical protein